ncbi:MAG: 2-oxoacid:acceptor oxidoreductase family protein [Clostridia bacterium]|nr:2-oxoacid:acceptor oxidoreductase family protein [Clostridia bacterium]MDD3832111.1 2-oxoacid:acceptor oxidoreductase family protein [Clostridia bacterium]
MEQGIICAGFGGQGVLSLGKMIVYVAMEKGLHVTWLPSYGPEMRGGTANCSVVASTEEVASPLVSTPDCLIAMNRPSLDKFINDVVSGGMVLINSSLIDIKVDRKDINVYYIPANDLALQHANERSSNIVMYGAYAKLNGNIGSMDEFEKILIKQFGKSADKDKIISAFHAGYEEIKV